ncbi:DUF3467 domain-containing protein [Halomonas sp. H5]|uniref:DUF3467 domain-containing protein n=1 Tax=Halomonas sp. H5 TaxID=3423910 RepID=UPI003D367747
MSDAPNDAQGATGATGGAEKSEKGTPKVVWDDSSLNMSYANVVNVTSTREEVTLFFGTNQTWNARESEFKVKLHDRIILSPFAAKRLLALLSAVVGEYEKRYGKLDISDPRGGHPGS